MSQEVWPFVRGGGIGRYVRDAAMALAPRADVTVLTSERWFPDAELLGAGEDGHLIAPGVRVAWAPEPAEDVTPFWSWFHASAAGYLQGLRELARTRPIDLVEYDDYRGIGAMVADAVRAGDTSLLGIKTVVRQDTSWEIMQLLDGLELSSERARWITALERAALRGADCLVSASEPAAEAYQRYYGDAALPDSSVIVARPNPAIPDEVAPPPKPAVEGLRLLYVGRLQEVKGVRSLIRAVRALPDAKLSLTLVGGDTETGPAGMSMREHLDLLAEGDPRIVFCDSVNQQELARIYSEHHVVAVPSRFESHGYVVREALALDRPVLVTPVGGLVGTAVAGRSGWCARDTSDAALVHALSEILQDLEAVDRIIASRGPSGVLHELGSDGNAFAATYLDMAAEPPSRGTNESRPSTEHVADSRRTTAMVRVRTPGARLHATLDALEAQTTGRPEILILVDDLAWLSVRDLERVDSAFGMEDGTADNELGYRGLVGRSAAGPVLFLDAGDILAPTFLRRTLRLLADPTVPYVSGWGTGRTRGNAPLGNIAAAVIGEPGVAASVTLASPETAELLVRLGPERAFATLAAADRRGLVVPETLVGRVRSGSPAAPDPPSLPTAAVRTIFGPA